MAVFTATSADNALASDAVARGPAGPRLLFDAALAFDAVGSGRTQRLATGDVARTTDQARHSGAAFVVHASDHALAADAGAGGSPRAFDVAFTNDSAFHGVPRPFTFDAAFARDIATGSTPHVHIRARDVALARDQAAGIAHHVIPPTTPIGETPLFVVPNVATGPIARSPATLAALRDRIEAMERSLQRGQTNRFSIGPRPDQNNVPVHALSNAAAMGDASDQHHMAFNAATGQFEPSGPVHAPGPALAGVLPPGPPYGFTSVVQTGSFTGVIAGGKLVVPFLDDAGNPIPFGAGVMGLTICVGDTERNL